MIPSIPGFGLSGPTSDAGWTHRRVARAFAQLMSRLGHGTYRAQGGDVGAQVSPDLGRVDPDRVVGVHVNAARVERIADFMDEDFGYASIQSTRPQTLAYGLSDSPVDQLAWIVEKFQEWTHGSEVPEDAVDRGCLLAVLRSGIQPRNSRSRSRADSCREPLRPPPPSTPAEGTSAMPA